MAKEKPTVSPKPLEDLLLYGGIYRESFRLLLGKQVCSEVDDSEH